MCYPIPSAGSAHNQVVTTVNTAAGLAAQTCLMIIPMYVVLLRPVPALAALALLFICAWLLKRFWWERCREDFETV